MPTAAEPLAPGCTQPALLGCVVASPADLGHDLLERVALDHPERVWHLEAVGR
jgi:hypothetical protein